MTACMGRSAGGKHSRSLHACAFTAPRIARALTPRTPLVAPRVRTAAGCRGPSLRAVVAKVSQTAPAVRIHLAPANRHKPSVVAEADEILILRVRVVVIPHVVKTQQHLPSRSTVDKD